MSTMVSNLKQYIPLLSELVTRDIKTKYRRSVLGVLWTLLNPLLMMIVLSIVFHSFSADLPLKLSDLSFERTGDF